MKTNKSIHTVYDDTPFDQWTLNGNGTQCQDDARKSLEEQHADRLIPLGQSLDLTKQNPREVMNDNEILQYFEAADLSDGL